VNVTVEQPGTIVRCRSAPMMMKSPWFRHVTDASGPSRVMIPGASTSRVGADAFRRRVVYLERGSIVLLWNIRN
jgi:hypothetical protein